MAITVTGRLNKDSTRFNAGDSHGFGVRIGVQSYNHKTKENEWTNYEAAIFAKGGQADFYGDALIAGAIVTVSGSGLLVKTYDGQNGQVITLDIVNARVEFVAQGAERPAQGQAQQRQPAPQNNAANPGKPQNPAPQSLDDFDSDIPF
jgi:single-stranded DNA-binding protein